MIKEVFIMRWIKIDSSKLEAVGYDESAMILRIQFIKDGIFEYYGVPPFVHKDLVETNHPERIFKQYIKDKYRYVRLQNQS